MCDTVITYDFSPFFEKFQFESSWEPHLDQRLFKNNMYICVLMMFSKVSLEAH